MTNPFKLWKINILTSLYWMKGTEDELMQRDFIKGTIARYWIQRFLVQLENDGLVDFTKKGVYFVTKKGKKYLGL